MKNKEKIYWEKRDEWWIKRFLSKDGKYVFSYHYQRKSAPAQPKRIIETLISHKLAGYLLIEKDLEDIAALLSAHEERFLGIADPENDIIVQAIMKAIVTTYGKCFTSATQRGSDRGRGIKLEAIIIPKAYLDLHLYMMDMRNQYISHGGDSMHEQLHLLLLVPPLKEIKKGLRGKNVSGYVKLQKCLTQTTTVSLLNNDELTPLIIWLLKYVQTKIKKLTDKLELSRVDPALLWSKFPKEKNLVLDEKKLKSIQRGINEL